MTFDMQKAREMAARGIPTVDPYSHSATALYLALGEIERLQQTLAAKDAELARWHRIAIDERARLLCAIDTGCSQWSQVNEKFQEKYRCEAAKELGIRAIQEAGYVKRLEAAYVDMVFRATGSDDDAQAALAKIREGK